MNNKLHKIIEFVKDDFTASFKGTKRSVNKITNFFKHLNIKKVIISCVQFFKKIFNIIKQFIKKLFNSIKELIKKINVKAIINKIKNFFKNIKLKEDLIASLEGTKKSIKTIINFFKNLKVKEVANKCNQTIKKAFTEFKQFIKKTINSIKQFIKNIKFKNIINKIKGFFKKILEKKLFKNPIYKNTLIIATVSIILVLSIVVYFNKSLAWFTNNKEVGANGMTVVVDPNTTLVISTDATVFVSGEDGKSITEEIVFEDQTKTLSAATRKTINDVDGLYYVSYEDADMNTGAANSNDAYTLIPSTSNGTVNGVNYYLEHIFYMGAVGNNMNCTDLYACIYDPEDELKEEDFLDTLKTVKIDVIILDDKNNDAETYLGTLSVINAIEETNNHVSFKTDKTAETLTLTAGVPYKVCLRLYFDGEMTYNDIGYTNNNTIVIRSNNLDATVLELNVAFMVDGLSESK